MIILDLDGVLVNFIGAWCKLQGVNLENSKLGAYHFRDMFPEELKHRTDEEIYKGLDYDFWKSLEWMHDGEEIFKCVEKLSRSLNGLVLWTQPVGNDGCVQGKIDWVKRELGSAYVKKLIIGVGREMVAFDKRNILIDDFDDNIDRFRINGGSAIQIPRRWNRLYMINCSIKIIERNFNDRLLGF